MFLCSLVRADRPSKQEVTVVRQEDLGFLCVIWSLSLSLQSVPRCEKVVSVVVVSHIQRIGCQPEKNYFTRWPIPLVVC